MTVDLEDKRMRLFEERRDFLDYMKVEHQKIDAAQEVVEQGKVQEDVIKQKQSDLFSLEERVLSKEEVFDRRQVDLDEREKSLKIKEAAFEMLQKGEKNDIT